MVKIYENGSDKLKALFFDGTKKSAEDIIEVLHSYSLPTDKISIGKNKYRLILRHPMKDMDVFPNQYIMNGA